MKAQASVARRGDESRHKQEGEPREEACRLCMSIADFVLRKVLV